MRLLIMAAFTTITARNNIHISVINDNILWRSPSIHDAYVFISANIVYCPPFKFGPYVSNIKVYFPLTFATTVGNRTWGVQIALILFNRTQQIVDIRHSHQQHVFVRDSCRAAHCAACAYAVLLRTIRVWTVLTNLLILLL